MFDFGEVVSRHARNLATLSFGIVSTAVSQELQNISTLVWAGSLPGADLTIGAVTLGNMFCNITGFSLAYGLCTGLDAFVSQSFGAGQYRMMGLHTQRAIVILTIFCVPTAILWLSAAPILEYILFIPPDVAALAGRWARILSCGLWPAVAFECLRKFLQGQGVIWPVVMTTCLGLLFNVSMNYVFIKLLGWGFDGCALVVPLTNWFHFSCLSIIMIVRKKVIASSSKGVNIGVGYDTKFRHDPNKTRSGVSYAAVKTTEHGIADDSEYMEGSVHGKSSAQTEGTDASTNTIEASGKERINSVLRAVAGDLAIDEWLNEPDEVSASEKSATAENFLNSAILDVDLWMLRSYENTTLAMTSHAGEQDEKNGIVFGGGDYIDTDNNNDMKSAEGTVYNALATSAALQLLNVDRGDDTTGADHLRNHELYVDIASDDENMMDCDTDVKHHDLSTAEILSDPEDNWPPASMELFENWWMFLRLGIPGAVSLFIEWGSFELAASIAGQLSPEELATHGIYMSTAGLFYMIPQAVASATSTLAGNMLGEGGRAVPETKTVILLGVLTDTAYGLSAAGLLLFVLRPYWGTIFTSHPQTQKMVQHAMPVMALYVIVDATKCITLNILRSTGRPQITVWVNTLVCLCVLLPVGWYLAIKKDFGLFGLWSAMSLAWALATVFYAYILATLDWNQLRLVEKNVCPPTASDIQEF